MLSIFYRPRWDSPKAHLRIQALNAMAEDDARLLDMARTDSEPQVRAQALRRLQNLPQLLELSRRDLDAQVREAACERALELLARPLHEAPPMHERRGFIADIRLATILTRIIKSQADLDLRKAAVQALHDELHLEDIALNSSVAALRLAAAEKIQSETLLQALAEASRNHDKNVYRLTQQRLDALQAQRRALAENEARRQQLKEQVLQLAEAPDHPMYAARAAHLRQVWQDQARSEDVLALQPVWQRIHERCQAQEREQRRLRALGQAQSLWQSLRSRPLLMADLMSWAQAIADLEARLLDVLDAGGDASLAAMQEDLESWHQWWGAWTQSESRRAVCSSDEERIELLDRLLAVAMPAWVDAQAFRQALLAERQSLLPPTPATASSTTPPRQLSEGQLLQLSRLEALIEQGQAQKACELAEKTARWHSELPEQEERLLAVQSAVKNWLDWQLYALAPKQQALIEQAQALLASSLPPDQLHVQVRSLRKQWKALGQLDAPDVQARRQSFVELTRQIDLRCQTWLNERAQEHQRLVQQATQLSQTISTCVLPAADEVEGWRQLRQQWQTWRQQLSSWQAELKTQRTLLETLRTQIKNIGLSLREEEKRQLARMQELVLKAQQLSARSEAREVRQLQLSWRQLGIHRHRDNQQHWPQFQAAIQAWHERRLHAQNEHIEAIKALSVDAPDFVQQLQTLAEQCAGHAPALKLITQRQQEAQTRQESLKHQRKDTLIQRLLDTLAALDQGQQLSPLDDLPRRWRQHYAQAPLLSQASDRHQALLLWEGVLDIAAPEAERDLQRRLMLERWTRGERGADSETLLRMAWACMTPCPQADLAALRSRIELCLRKTLKEYR